MLRRNRSNTTLSKRMSSTTRNLLINNNFPVYLILPSKMMNISRSYNNLASIFSSINNLFNMILNLIFILKITSLNQMTIYLWRLNFNIIIEINNISKFFSLFTSCLLYTSPSPRDRVISRMPSSA